MGVDDDERVDDATESTLEGRVDSLGLVAWKNRPKV
jgi:hypothetical protein